MRVIEDKGRAGGSSFIPPVGGSNPPTPAKLNPGESSFKLETLISQIAQLSQHERETLLTLSQSQSVSTLSFPADGIDDWKSHLIARGLAEGTITLYTGTVKKFLSIYPQPSIRDVRNYSVQRLEKVTPTKVRNDQKALRSFFNFLEDKGLWLDNPTKRMQLLKTKKVTRQAPDKEHVDKLRLLGRAMIEGLSKGYHSSVC